MKNVACYCRVSTDEQVKFGFSIDAQKDNLIKYCKENKLKYELFVDEGISASSMNRPALQKMLNRLEEFDAILFTKLDRLSRNVLDANTINKMLIQNKCIMKAIDEDDIDTSTADGTFMFNLKVSLAQREIEKTSERIKFVFQNKREKGEITSGTCKYGYTIVNKKYAINNIEAENINNLYKYFVSVNGNMQLTYAYFIQHFPQKGRDALSKYLRDTSYIGKYKLYRKNIYIDNYIPAIVDLDLWNKVQSLLVRKTVTRKNTYEDIFSGLLFCAECQNRLSKKVDNRCKKIVVRYVCDTSYRTKPGTLEKKCSNTKSIRESKIEEYLLSNIKNEVEKYIVRFDVKAEIKSIDNTQKINSLKHKLDKLKELFISDLIDIDTYKNDYNKYQSEIKKLQVEEPKKDFTNLKRILDLDIITLYSKLNNGEKKHFWLSLIEKIYIENGKIKEITFL